MWNEIHILVHLRSLHPSLSIHLAPGITYLTRPILSLNLFPRCFHFLLLLLLLFPSPSGISQVKQLFFFSPPQMFSCSHPLPSVPPLCRFLRLNNTPPFHSSRTRACSFIVRHTLSFIRRHTLQLAGHRLLHLLYLSLLWFICLPLSTLSSVSLHHFIIQLKTLLSTLTSILQHATPSSTGSDCGWESTTSCSLRKHVQTDKMREQTPSSNWHLPCKDTQHKEIQTPCSALMRMCSRKVVNI